MKQIVLRLIIGVSLALSMALLTVLVQPNVQAQTQTPPKVDCKICHEAFYTAWESGVHGQAEDDPVFKKSWEDQDKPAQCLSCHATGYDPETGTVQAEGVTCKACHNAAQSNHPMEPMGVDRSGKLCGTCHTETYFEWQVSKHRETELACASCHDPHTTTLKTSTSSDLCATCHQTRSSNFSHSAHSAEGLTCADCHLGPLTGESGEGHATRDHSFQVTLRTCNTCHAYQMHDPVEVHSEVPTPEPLDSMASVETLPVSKAPPPSNPTGLAALAGVIGLVVGMVAAPQLGRWYRRINRK